MAGMHTPLRIALAVLVTLWSPAWCQCMLLAAMHDDHPAHAAPDQESSNAATAELQCDSDACCDAFAPQTLSLMQCCPGDCNAPVGAPCACECCDQTVTGAQAPAQQSATFTVALCALDALLDYGRPAKIELATLIDRGHREIPIAPDYVGITLETNRLDHVLVSLEGTDGNDQIRIVQKEDP